MKIYVQSCHLTEFDAFGVNGDQVIDLETCLKSVQVSVILRQRPPKPYKFLKWVISFVTTVKSCHSVTIWKKLR